MLRDLFRFFLVLLLIVAFGYFVYPTPYHYSMFRGEFPVKINWITGKTEVLSHQDSIPLRMKWYKVTE